MCKHTIFLANDFVIHKRFIALDVTQAKSENSELPTNVLDKLNALLEDSNDFSVQCLSTDSKL